MKVRFPKMNFDDVPAIWGADLEYTCMVNANSTTLPALEPFLIKANNKAKTLLDPIRDAQLIKEIDWFNAQESQHYRLHRRFNKVFEDGRYPRLEAMEKEYLNHFDKCLAEKPLSFCLAYAEGFESVGSVFYRAWFELQPKFRIGAHDDVIRMWDWHNAEEFEHKEVAYKTYMAVCARGSIWKKVKYGYFYRLYGIWSFIRHTFPYTTQVREHMLEIERQRMTPEEVKASKKNEKQMVRAIAMSGLRGLLLHVMSPFYNPNKISPPRGLDLVLQRFEPGGQYGPAITAAAPKDA